jgi:argininosuccinate synthase
MGKAAPRFPTFPGILLDPAARWRSPVADAERSQKAQSNRRVAELNKGNIMTADRKSPISLYNPAIATREAGPTKAYNQDYATGFIRLNALRLKVAARVRKRR